MFEKAPKSYTDLLGKTNRLVEGTIVHGNIASSADFRLDGSVTGNIKCQGKLVIGPACVVQGDIVCRNLDIEGKVIGKIEVLEMLSVKSKAKIQGEVVCSKLSVEPGAEFSASCIMRSGAKNPDHAAAAQQQ
jgi:cytoskeletal protein CcmA (bactofilin family)